MRNEELANEGQALGVVGAGQPDVGPAAADSVGGLGEEPAHGRGQVAEVGPWVGGGHQVGELGQAGGFGRDVGGLLDEQVGRVGGIHGVALGK